MASSDPIMAAAAWTPASPLLSVTGLKKWFPITSGLVQRTVGQVRAVDGVNLQVRQGETLGLVGESGCGKSTLGRTILRLLEPTAGTIHFKGQDLTQLRLGAMRRRRRELAMVFQDPYSSLDPRQTVGDIIGEPLDVHRLARGRQRRERIRELLGLVGMNPAFVNRYPHEFSAGQRQRIGIARALAGEPSFIVCDEAISALDVSIQAQIINLLERLQEELGLTYLFIAHDLSVVRHISDRIAVMYLGRLMEVARAQDLHRSPRHPYTVSLLSAIPIPDPTVERGRQRIILTGEVPSPAHPLTGCRFRTRCFNAQERCALEEPPLDTVKVGDHEAACFFPVDP